MNKENNTLDGKLTAGTHISYWTDSISNPSYPPLKDNLEADVVIVGGGISGVSIAYCLSESGKSVVLVEDGFIGSGETGRTSAHVTVALDAEYYEMEKTFGKEDTKLIAESHTAAIDFIERTCKKEKIDCDFERVNGYLFLHPTDDNDALKKELEAASNAGLDVTELEETPGLLTNERCIRFGAQAIFHPLKYIVGLSKAAEKNGVRIFTETHADKIDHEGITTDDGFTVKAKHVVVATNSPVNNKVAMHLKQNGYMSYVMGALVKKGSVPNALWWDTGDTIKNPDVPPYHYVRLNKYDEKYDLLIFGGEDHPIGDTTAGGVTEKHRYAALEAWARRHFPIEDIVYQWSGEVMESIDNLAFIGRNTWDKDNVYIVTGDCGDGMTYSSIAGMLISDLILGKDNKWEKIYSPSRLTFSKLNIFFKGLLQGMVPDKKKSVHDEKNEDLLTVQRGVGKIMTVHGEKCGVFRDDADRLHVVSAKCTHLGCSIAWNNDEQCWDCPCHGSRFTYEGKVIHGPANKDLPSYTFSATVANGEMQDKEH